MAKKKKDTSDPKAPQPDDGADRPSSNDSEEKTEAPPEVLAAEKAVRRAEAELNKAKAFCEKVRQKAADRWAQARQTTLGDVVDGTLRLVRRFPGSSVVVAGALGFFLGRLLRR
ncbi:MAG: hypothetical protein ACYTG0_29790 [Planctomycetota bacterium]|jgi:ElaB/YqjD/DUF883 family membrane-anchored ribosome-binding protein